MPEDTEREDLGEGQLSDAITSINVIVTNFERKLTGWRQTGKGSEWVYTGEVLVGEKTASRLAGFLQSVCNRANLISENDDLAMEWEKLKLRLAAYDSLLLDIGCEEHMNSVMTMFSTTVERVISIIKASKSMFKDYFKPEGYGENSQKSPMY